MKIDKKAIDDMIDQLPYAFSFNCELSRYAIRARFQEIGSYEWFGVDSDNYGFYSRGTPIPIGWPAVLRVYGEEPPDYLLEFDYDFEALYKGISPTHVIAFVKEQLLPSIGAKNVKQTEGIR